MYFYVMPVYDKTICNTRIPEINIYLSTLCTAAAVATASAATIAITTTTMYYYYYYYYHHHHLLYAGYLYSYS